MGGPGVQPTYRYRSQPEVNVGVAMPHYQRGSALAEYARVCRTNCISEVQTLANEVLTDPKSTAAQKEYARAALAYTGPYNAYMQSFERGERTDALLLEKSIRNGEAVCRELESYLPESSRKKRVSLDQRFREYEESRARSKPLLFSQSARGGHFVDLPESWTVTTRGGTTESADISGGRRRYYVSNLKEGAEITISGKDFTFTAKLSGTKDPKSLQADRAIGATTQKPAPAPSPVAAVPPVVVTPAGPYVGPAPAAAPVSNPEGLTVTPPATTPLPAPAVTPAKEKLMAEAKTFTRELRAKSSPSGLYRHDRLDIPTDVAQRNQVVEPFHDTEPGGTTAFVFPRRFKDPMAGIDVSGVLFMHNKDLMASTEKAIADLPSRECVRAAYRHLAKGLVQIEVWMNSNDAKGYQYCLRSDGSVVVRRAGPTPAQNGTIYSPIFGEGGSLSWKSKDVVRASDGRYYPPTR